MGSFRERKIIDEWIANLIKEIQVKSKDKLELLLALYPPTEHENTAMGEIKLAVTDAKVQDLGLYEPVQDLMNAILSDTDINIVSSNVLPTVH